MSWGLLLKSAGSKVAQQSGKKIAEKITKKVTEKKSKVKGKDVAKKMFGGEEKGGAFESRQQLRTEEAEALEKAIEIISSGSLATV